MTRLFLWVLATGLLGLSACSTERGVNAESSHASATQGLRDSTVPPGTPADTAPLLTAVVIPSAAPNPSVPMASARPVAAPEGAADSQNRVYAKSRFVWIKEQPGGESWIGFLWMGGSVKLRSPSPIAAAGCSSWYAIEPRGFICVDGATATLDASDPALAQLRPYAPRLDSPWPHHYGESRGAPRYDTLPSPDLQRRREWDLDAHRVKIAEASASGKVADTLRDVDLKPAGMPGFSFTGLPATVHEPRKELRPQSTVAWSGAVDHLDRAFLVSADLMWVPKDRVAVYPQVTFHGVVLGRDARLPLAFFRGKDRPQYLQAPTGEFADAGKAFPRLSWIELTGVEHTVGPETYLETRQAGVYVRKSDAVLPRPQEKTPWGAAVGQPDTVAAAPKGRRTWMEVSVLGGWLIAYEDTTPVYVTLIAPGRGGVPERNRDPLETASTPTGYFKITGKFATATMVAPHEFVHSDVPWTQNFSGPHAIHGAYWHDDWGNKKSAGCINVSPVDGRWLFHWTEPLLPEGWHGVRWEPKKEPASTLIVHN